MLTSCLNVGRKLDQGFYFPCSQEEPEREWFYDAPGFFSPFGSSFFCLLVSSKIFSRDSFSPPQIFLCLHQLLWVHCSPFMKLITLCTPGPASRSDRRGNRLFLLLSEPRVLREVSLCHCSTQEQERWRRCHSSLFPRRPYRMFLFSMCGDPSHI